LSALKNPFRGWNGHVPEISVALYEEGVGRFTFWIIDYAETKSAAETCRQLWMRHFQKTPAGVYDEDEMRPVLPCDPPTEERTKTIHEVIAHLEQLSQKYWATQAARRQRVSLLAEERARALRLNATSQS
jgi:hypothetical protein